MSRVKKLLCQTPGRDQRYSEVHGSPTGAQELGARCGDLDGCNALVPDGSCTNCLHLRPILHPLGIKSPGAHTSKVLILEWFVSGPGATLWTQALGDKVRVNLDHHVMDFLY